MATSNQDTNIKDVAAPASATPTNIGHVLGLNAAKTQDVLIPLSMLRQVIAQELQSALSAITSGSPNVPVLDGGNLKYMTLANFAKVAGGLKSGGLLAVNVDTIKTSSVYCCNNATQYGLPKGWGILLTVGDIYVSSYLALQMFYAVVGTSVSLYFRHLNGINNTWSDWLMVGLSQEG